MKKFTRVFLVLLSILALTASFFACKRKSETPASPADLGALSNELTESALPDGGLNREIAEKILDLFNSAGFETAETAASLRALKEKATDVAPALTGVYENAFSEESIPAYRAALGAVSEAVSPEKAGELFYAAASEAYDSLPFSLSDCRAAAALLFGINQKDGDALYSAATTGDYSAIGKRELNTVLMTFSSSLLRAKGISDAAKEYLFGLFSSYVQNFTYDVELTSEQKEHLAQAKTYILRLGEVLKEHYEFVLSFASAFCAEASARVFLGGEYEKRERTTYYGYEYDSWKATEITESDYEEKAGDFDEYFALTDTVLGYSSGDTFTLIPEKDVTLGEKIYKLQTAYRAYLSMTDEQKEECKVFLNDALSVLSLDPELVAILFDLEIKKPSEGAPIASFEEAVSALSSLLSFESTDGVSSHERAASSAATETIAAYLRSYLPTLF